MYLTYAICLCFSSVFPQFRLQGDNMAERPEDVSMVSQTSEPAMSDSDGKWNICCTSKNKQTATTFCI